MNTHQLTPHINKIVTIENYRGSKYRGKLSGFKHKQNKFCLTRLAIINRVGAFIVSGQPESRWFSADNFHIIDVTEEYK